MSFKSATPPLCRFCGKPIAKNTQPVQFGPNGRKTGDDARREKPLSLAAARRQVNGKIVSVRWTEPKALVLGEWVRTEEPRWINEVGVWDGESYRDAFFCSGSHAQSYAYMVVERCGLVSQAYNAAIKSRAIPAER